MDAIVTLDSAKPVKTDVTFSALIYDRYPPMTVQHCLRLQVLPPRRLPFKFSADSESGDDQQNPAADHSGISEREELPYKVELWDASKTSVEQVLAVTANASIGYAAYYAATREHAERYITLRHKNGIVSRWNGPSH